MIGNIYLRCIIKCKVTKIPRLLKLSQFVNHIIKGRCYVFFMAHALTQGSSRGNPSIYNENILT